jgi:hypothetical protein
MSAPNSTSPPLDGKIQVGEMEVRDELRSLQGHEVTLVLRPGDVRLEGRIRGLLDSADGLVVYVVDHGGRVHTVHHHQVLEVRATTAC